MALVDLDGQDVVAGVEQAGGQREREGVVGGIDVVRAGLVGAGRVCDGGASADVAAADFDAVDFDRGDSSLSVGRAEVYRKSCERRVELPLFRRKIMAAKAYAKKLWWMLSGVSVCSNRTNVNLYMCNKRD